MRARVLLVALLLLPMFALAQSDDRGFLQGLLEDSLSDAGRVVRIEGFSGALSSRATIEQLTIADDDGVWLILRGAALQWNRGQLVRGRVEIAEITAEEMLLPRAPVTTGPGGAPKPEATPFTLPQLPVSLELGQVRVGRLVVGAPILGQEAAFTVQGAASLIDGAGQADLAVRRIGQAPAGEITFAGSFSNTSRVLSLDLRAEEAAGGLAATLLGLPETPAAQLRIAGTGPISDYQADVALSTDAEPRLTGQVTLSAEPVADGSALRRAFRVALDGDLRPLVVAPYRPFLGAQQRLFATGQSGPEGVTLEDLSIRSAAMQVEAQLQTDATGWPVRIAAAGFVTPPDGAEDILLSLPGAETRIAGARFVLDHDASVSDTWTLDLGLDGLAQEDVALDRAQLAGSGVLSRDLRRAEGSLALDLRGLAPKDATLAQAIGGQLDGQLSFLWTDGGALRLTGVDLTGADYGLVGDASVRGVTGAVDLEVTGAGRLIAQDLSRFAGLAGLGLTGAAEVALQGQLSPISGAFDLDITGGAEGLGLGIAELDALLAGEADLALTATRDAQGVRLEAFEVSSPTVTLRGAGDVSTRRSDLTLGLDLADLGLAVPGADGPASVSARARGRGDDWSLTAEATAPGDARLGFDGAITLFGSRVGPVSGALDVALGDLTRYAALLPAPMRGAVALSGRLDGDVTQARYVVRLDGMGRGLAAGIAQLDPLLAGETSLTLRADMRDAVVALTELDVRAEEASVRASGTLDAARSDVDLAVTLQDLGRILPQLSGPAELSAKLGHLGPVVRVDAEGRGPGASTLDVEGALTLVDGQPGPVLGTLSASVGEIAAFAGLIGAEVSGAADLTLDGRGDLGELSFEGQMALTGRDLGTGVALADRVLAGESRLDAQLAVADGAARIDSVSIRSDAARLSASGTASRDQSTITFDAALTDLGLLEQTLQGPATLSGQAGHTGPVLRVDAQGAGPGQSALAVDGSVTFEAGRPRTVLGVANGAVPDLSVFAALAQRPLSGAATVEIGGQGDLQDLSAVASVDARLRDLAVGVPQVDALLRGDSTLSAGGALRGGQLLLERFLLDGPALRAMASGSVAGRDADLTFDATLKQPGAVVPGLPGPLTMAGTAVRTGEAGGLEARLTGPGGARGTVDLDLTLPTSGAPRVSGRFDFTADSLAPYGRVAQRPFAGALSASGSGQVDLANMSLNLQVDARGGGLRVGLPTVDALLAGTSRARAAVTRAGDGALGLRLETLETPLLTASGTGQLAGAQERLAVSARLRDVSALIPGVAGAAEGRLEASASGGPFRVALTASGPGGATASASGQVMRDFASAALSITGGAPLGLANRFIAPNLVEGQARFDLGLNGPLALSSLTGTVSASGGRLTVPLAKIGLTEITARLGLAAGAATVEASGAVTTGGRVSVTGQVGLLAPFDGQLRAVLAGIRAVEPGLYDTSINGTLGLSGPLASRAALTGTLDIGQTEIRLPEVASTANGEIVGLVHLNEPAAVRQTRAFAGLLATSSGGGGIDYPVDLVIRAPSRVFIRGRGLDAELGGSLRLRGSLQDVITEGRFELTRGRLDLLGQRLDLTEASATLQVNLDPYIRAVAVTTRDSTDIQITVEGLASDPEVTFSSAPELPQDEVLALLLFGRNIAQISPLQALRLANAIRVLAGDGGEGLVGQLRQSFGLDDLDLETDENNQAQVRLGKHLSENVYTDVTVGTTGRSEINLNLTITPSLTVRGSVASDGNTGLGLFFEKDY